MDMKKIEEIRINSHLREEIDKIRGRGVILNTVIYEGLKLLEDYNGNMHRSRKLNGFNVQTTVTFDEKQAKLLKKMREKYKKFSKVDIICNAVLLFIKRHNSEAKMKRLNEKIFNR